MLKKKTASIYYYFFTGGVSTDTWRTAVNVNTKDNPVDISLTKNLSVGFQMAP